MERVIATHRLDGHRLDVVESIDEDTVTVWLLVDGELLPPDAHPEREPTAAEVASLLTSRRAEHPDDAPSSGNRGGLHAAEVIALLEALDDEYLAHATYAQVLADFGDVRPFANIVEAEARHIDALTRLMRAHEVPVPSNPWPGKVPRYGSVAEACAAGVEAEIANGALYDRLLAAGEHPDVIEVFRNLQAASQQRHLPAFERCVERGAGGGRSAGRGRGGRRRRHRGGEA